MADKEGRFWSSFYKFMKAQKIINFSGMDFREERQPSVRLSRRARLVRTQRSRVATNVRGIFENLFGF